MTAHERPFLSVIVGIVSDTTESRANTNLLAACLQALSNQLDAPPIEVIVPYHQDVDGIEDMQKQFPRVVFTPVTDPAIASRKRGSREHHDILRARGMGIARGELIGLLEDHAQPDRKWCANVAAAHRQAPSAIGGAIENGADRPLNWAVYFCDFGKYQNPLPAGESSLASDANVTYKKSALEPIRAVWERSFREIVVNGALKSRGEKVALQPDVIVYQNRQGLRIGRALRERYIWGRSYAATRAPLLSTRQLMFYAALSPVLPAMLLLRMSVTAWTRRRRFGKFVKAFPLIALCVSVWSVGEGVGYVTGLLSGPHRDH